MDNNAKQQAVERIKNAQNVLVTVSKSPSVDQLAAAIGLALLINKLGKHATAVYSGETPSTLEFLQPEETIEKNTDSLRDFIISLDKSKADKLRYKVDDEAGVVRIFITPYRTSLSEKDLDFSQGDFNVDVVIALGVKNREDLDQAIVAHGRILHDATVIAINTGNDENALGSIDWHDAAASSLCEMIVSITEAFQSGLIDAQMATAFLTGIVSETARFSNAKTSPKVMTMSAQLMAAGANQQLIASKLAMGEDSQASNATPASTPKTEDTIELSHHEEEPEHTPDLPVEHTNDDGMIHIDEHGTLMTAPPAPAAQPEPVVNPEPPKNDDMTPAEKGSLQSPAIMTEPPVLGSPLNSTVADSAPVETGASVDGMAVPEQNKALFDTPQNTPAPLQPEPAEVVPPAPFANEPTPVPSPDVTPAPVAGEPPATVDAARDAVMSAINAAPFDADRPEPIQALNAQSVPLDVPAAPVAPMSSELNSTPPTDVTLPQPFTPPAPSETPPPAGFDMPELGLPGAPSATPAPATPSFMPPSTGQAFDPSLPQPGPTGTAPVNPPPILPPVVGGAATPMTPYQHQDLK